MILLDTCGLLWLAAGSPQISDTVRRKIDSEAVVSVSAISAFEIGLKYRTGKLKLPTPPGEWWSRVVAHHRLNVIPVDAEIGIRATELPPVHRDPADRFIIATALQHKTPVVTADSRFADYGVEVIL